MAGKTGFLYVSNHVTGEPLWPKSKKKSAQTERSGEQSWPTQPFPTVFPALRARRHGSQHQPLSVGRRGTQKGTEMVRNPVNKGCLAAGNHQHDPDSR